MLTTFFKSSALSALSCLTAFPFFLGYIIGAQAGLLVGVGGTGSGGLLRLGPGGVAVVGVALPGWNERRF